MKTTRTYQVISASVPNLMTLDGSATCSLLKSLSGGVILYHVLIPAAATTTIPVAKTALRLSFCLRVISNLCTMMHGKTMA